MVSGKPPRHTKSEQEPVTIDLEATKAGPGEAEDIADRPDNANKPEDIAVSKVSDDPAATADDGAQAPHQDEPAVNTAAAAFSEEPATSHASRSAPRQASAASSSSLAAGIVGGLIALVAAGGLQYAGVLASLGPARDDGSRQQAIESEIAGLRAEVAGAQQPSQTVDLAPLENRLSGLEQKLAEIPSSSSGEPVDLSGLETAIASLTAELDTVKATLAETGRQQQASSDELAGRLSAAEEKLSQPSSDARMARAVAATALKTAIERGGPFLSELDALASVAPDDPAVAGLRDDAATGVPARADLARSFPETANAMLDAVTDTGPQDGVFTRLMNSASSLVRVRPVGNIEGDTPEAIIARIEDKIVNGDLTGASLEWETLPEKARTAGAAFKETLDRRIKVEDLVGGSVSGAMSGNNQG